MDFQIIEIVGRVFIGVMVVTFFVGVIMEYRDYNMKYKCFDCKKPLKKYPEFHKFDARHGGEYKGGKTGKLCTKCLIKNLKEYFNNYKYKAAIIEPFKPFNAYDFATIEYFKKWYKEDKINSIKQLIKNESACLECGKNTKLVLYPPEIYSKNPYDFVINKEINGKHYCADCLCEHIEKIIERERIYFEHVYPPRGEEDGVMSSFET